ncbi:DUF134 domain-containing protein [Candidatus Woesearchaeota archaeon]|nr:DUF134 domain-containing protein [Candidatus Woesearchaeota archaeon]
MPRPKKERCIEFKPRVTCFKPCGADDEKLERVHLALDEIEALRLINILRMDQRAAAEFMGVHQSTLQRILTDARDKVTDALINGKAIEIPTA